MEAARLKIISIATKLFLRFGFKYVTMDDIAEKGHLSKKTIYQHFLSKEQLISAVLQELESMIGKQLDHILFKSGNSIESFFNLCKYIFLQQCNHPTAIRTLKKHYPVKYSLFYYLEEKLVLEKAGGQLKKGIGEGLFIPVLELKPLCCFLYRVSTMLIKKPEISYGCNLSKEVLVNDLIYYSLRSVVSAPGLLLLEKMYENYPD